MLDNNKSNDVIFYIDGSAFTGKIITNKVSVMNQWDFRGNFMTERDESFFAKNMDFVEYMQFMTATGGNKERDLFSDPLDTAALDDYDFSPLVTACRNVIRQGIRPFIKTGNIPLKFSAREPEMGTFGVNIFKPADYDIYYNYIAALAGTLVSEFGLHEVKNWKWGVFTEYENADWFVGDKTASGAMTAYCKIYDYTVAALTDILGDDIYIGAHSMTCSEGMWDERDFIKHCAAGTNFKTGKTGTPIRCLSISFYDITPNQANKISLIQSVGIVRNTAESFGLNLEYGIDEGRILNGTDGKPLTSRVVGFTYQAGYDARLFKQMVDYNIDYFAAWCYLTGDIFDGLKTVSHHVASRFYKMVGSVVTEHKTIKSDLPEQVESDLIASYNKDEHSFYLMAYCFKNDMKYSGTINAEFIISLPMFTGKVKITRYLVDDNANFFDKWRADAALEGKENTTGWSADSAHIIMPFDRVKYEKYSELVPKDSITKLDNGSVTLNVPLTGNAVVFYVIEQQ
jgi:hypothetical protein